MDDRDEQLALLARSASNAPTASPAPSHMHDVVRAVVRGIGGPLKEQLDALRAENAALRERVDALEARQATTPNLRRVV